MLKYQKVLAMGHRLLKNLFTGEVELSEKVDGSQLRLHLSPGYYQVGSKGVDNTTEKMFDVALDVSRSIHQETRWQDIAGDITLFCEYLESPHHNTITYDQVPKNHLYLFGAIINNAPDDPTTYSLEMQNTAQLIKIADTLGISPPNILSTSVIPDASVLNSHFETDSFLGGAKIEGVVIKNYNVTYDPLLVSTQAFTGYPLVGKHVNPNFSEINNKNWKATKASQVPIQVVVEKHLTEARFLKAVQHLNERGLITNEKRDLKDLIPEFYSDLIDECNDDITTIVMSHFYSDLKRRCASFTVKSYINYLTEKQFEE